MNTEKEIRFLRHIQERFADLPCNVHEALMLSALSSDISDHIHDLKTAEKDRKED